MASPILKSRWAPENANTNSYIVPRWLNNSTITSLTYRQTRLSGLCVARCYNLTSISAPNLTIITGGNSPAFNFIRGGISLYEIIPLTTLSLPVLQRIEGGVGIDNCDFITQLAFPALTEVILNTSTDLTYGNSFTIVGCASLSSVDLSALTTLAKVTTPNPTFDMWISGNPSLNNIDISNFVFPNTGRFAFGSNALTQSCVDAILAQAVANPAYVSGNIVLTGGSNATPSATGLSNKAILVGRGVTVTNN